MRSLRQHTRALKKTRVPAIMTCFRQGEGYAPEQSVLDFMKHLDEELGHYFKRYTHIDSLKLSLLMQMKLMNLDVPVEIENSRVMVGGQEALTLENIPMWSKNADFQHLKAEYEACERAYLDAKANTDNPITDAAFLKASQRWHDAKKALQQLEQDLFSIALKAEEMSRDGNLTARQRKAYALMEQGDSEGANQILDLNEILSDAAHVESLAEQAEAKLEQNVQELLQKIGILKIQTENPNRFDEIRGVFEEAVALEERRHLKKTAMRAYISYLYEQHDYQKAVPLAEKYMKCMEQESAEADIADAAKEYLRAKEIYKQLAAENPSAYLPDLAMSCNNLGVLYSDTNRKKEAETEYLRAKEIREQLAAENPSVYLPNLATNCNNIGVLYYKTNRMKEAEAEYLRAKKIREQLAAETSSVYLPILAGVCSNLGNLYYKTNRMEEAETEYLCAKKIEDSQEEIEYEKQEDTSDHAEGI